MTTLQSPVNLLIQPYKRPSWIDAKATLFGHYLKTDVELSGLPHWLLAQALDMKRPSVTRALNRRFVRLPFHLAIDDILFSQEAADWYAFNRKYLQVEFERQKLLLTDPKDRANLAAEYAERNIAVKQFFEPFIMPFDEFETLLRANGVDRKLYVKIFKTDYRTYDKMYRERQPLKPVMSRAIRRLIADLDRCYTISFNKM